MTRAAKGGHQRRFAVVVHASVDVFEHHNGVVHDQPDGQHQGEQGEQVDGEVHRRERRESANHGNRHRDGGDEGRAQVAQEQKDHHHHEPHGDKEGHHHLLDGTGDEYRGVVIQSQRHDFGQSAL